MGSIHRDTRDRQKTELAGKVEALKAKLKAAGLDEAQIGRSPLYRQAVAKLKKAGARIKAIDAKDALTQSLKEKKAAGKAPKVKEPKKKAAPKAAEEGKSKKKAKSK